MKELYADIAVSLPVEGLFTYRVPPSLRDGALFGHRALVPFGRRVVTGYIVGIKREAGVDGLKDILDILDDSPIFDEKRLQFYRWMSSYYFSPLGEVLSLIHPAEANVRSRRLLTLTDAGGAALNEATGLGRDILEASKKGVKILTLLKRFRGKPVCGTIARLKQDGLVVEESILEGGGRSKMERMVSLNHGAHGPHGLITPDELRRSPVQLRVYEYILKNGDTPAADLSSEINGADGAVKKLIEKGGLRIYLRQVIRDPMSGIAPRNAGHEPNQEQKEAIDAISESMKKSVFSPFLLYGVTGSGKTLVYLKLLQEAVAAGRQAILLVPEISLTPQTAAYLSGSFHGRVVVMHSALSSGERMDAWERISGGKVDVVVGARSALFSPLSKLSLIIIDEEHETSYKQEEGVRYNGRDAALMLGKYLDITVVLGSATPSVETFYNGHAGKLTTLYLRKRVLDRTLPKIELLDMRGKKDTVISTRLAGLLCDTLKHGRQSLLFLNRRGFSNSIICRDCGHAFQCPNCSVSLTFHKYPLSLVCHYCDLSSAPPSECPVCRGVNLRDPGIGTEKVEEEVKRLMPEARVIRMDRDTTRRKGSAKAIIDCVEDRSVDVLIGTQMASKGHHFPGITLVGIISGDTSLNIPDFRSAERTFQLVTQAAGRAGRGDAPGEVVIQTLNPDHYCFKSALLHDYCGFYKEEIKVREDLSYPPFGRLCCLRIDGVREDAVVKAASFLKAGALALIKKRKDAGISVLGPAPALLSRLRGRHRWQMLIKGVKAKSLFAFVSPLKASFEAGGFSGVSLIVDMDPITVV